MAAMGRELPSQAAFYHRTSQLLNRLQDNAFGKISAASRVLPCLLARLRFKLELPRSATPLVAALGGKLKFPHLLNKTRKGLRRMQCGCGIEKPYDRSAGLQSSLEGIYRNAGRKRSLAIVSHFERKATEVMGRNPPP